MRGCAARARRQHHSAFAQTIARSARKCDAGDCQLSRETHCAAVIFVHSCMWCTTHGRRHRDSAVAGRKRIARTLSRDIWQQKNFHARTASRLIAARQNRFFARIAAADSRTRDFRVARRLASPLIVTDQMHRACTIARNADDASGVTSREVQMPSLDLSRSLTACGLALPPDDFITWPTNQPISCGLALRLRDLVGIGGDDRRRPPSRSRRCR